MKMRRIDIDKLNKKELRDMLQYTINMSDSICVVYDEKKEELAVIPMDGGSPYDEDDTEAWEDAQNNPMVKSITSRSARRSVGWKNRRGWKKGTIVDIAYKGEIETIELIKVMRKNVEYKVLTNDDDSTWVDSGDALECAAGAAVNLKKVRR